MHIMHDLLFVGLFFALKSFLARCWCQQKMHHEENTSYDDNENREETMRRYDKWKGHYNKIYVYASMDYTLCVCVCVMCGSIPVALSILNAFKYTTYHTKSSPIFGVCVDGCKYDHFIVYI